MYFRLKVRKELGKATAHIVATSGNHKAHYDIELDVRYRTSTHSISCNNGEWQDEFSNYSAFRGEGLNCQHHFSYNASTYLSDLNDVDLDRYVLEWSDWHYFIVWEENTVIVES